ncbi:MAG: hypothetical protein V7L21_00080 [Nostoc sp.]|nr:hypothetical protein [Nostoc sp. NMS9]
MPQLLPSLQAGKPFSEAPPPLSGQEAEPLGTRSQPPGWERGYNKSLGFS